MNAKSLTLSIVALVASASAVAGELGPEYGWTPGAATSVTRADVQRDAAAARQAGQILDGERTFVAAPAVGDASRAQVRAEAAEARRLGLIASGEQSVAPTVQQLEMVRSAGERASAPSVAAR